MNCALCALSLTRQSFHVELCLSQVNVVDRCQFFRSGRGNPWTACLDPTCLLLARPLPAPRPCKAVGSAAFETYNTCHCRCDGQPCVSLTPGSPDCKEADCPSAFEQDCMPAHPHRCNQARPRAATQAYHWINLTVPPYETAASFAVFGVSHLEVQLGRSSDKLVLRHWVWPDCCDEVGQTCSGF